MINEWMWKSVSSLNDILHNTKKLHDCPIKLIVTVPGPLKTVNNFQVPFVWYLVNLAYKVGKLLLTTCKYHLMKATSKFIIISSRKIYEHSRRQYGTSITYFPDRSTLIYIENVSLLWFIRFRVVSALFGNFRIWSRKILKYSESSNYNKFLHFKRFRWNFWPWDRFYLTTGCLKTISHHNMFQKSNFFFFSSWE